MAKVTFYDALGNLTISDIIDDRTLQVAGGDSKSVTILDQQKDGFTVTGAGLKVGGFGLSAGTVTGFSAFTGDGDTLLTIENMSVDAVKLASITAFSGLAAALLYVFNQRDTFIGSANGDLMISGGGADILKGNGGTDILGGSKGNDTLTGGADSDQFLFVRGDGVDLIKDFEDKGNNLATDDHIVMTRSLFNTMVATDAVDGVHLDFAGVSTIILANHTVADITREDFIFV